MFGPTTCYQPADIYIESVGNMHEQGARRGAPSSTSNDPGDGALGHSDVALNVGERDLARAADELNALGNRQADRDCVFVCRVAVGVSRKIAHRTEGGHVTAGPLADRMIRGSALHFSRQMPNLLKGFLS